MKTDVQVDVDTELLLIQLDLLKEIVDKKEITAAERQAARLLMSQGKSRLSSTLKGHSTHLIKSFTYSMRKGKFAGIKVGFARPGGNVSHLVDLGTRDRYTKNGAYRGKIQGSHFWTDTKETYVPQAMDIMTDAIDSAIKKINSR